MVILIFVLQSITACFILNTCTFRCSVCPQGRSTCQHHCINQH